MLFNAAGQFNLTSISQFGSDIWDNGSETEDPANAAFLVGGVNDNRTPQNSVVNFNFSRLNAFNGLITGAGYVFNNQTTRRRRLAIVSLPSPPRPRPASGLLLMMNACRGRPKGTAGAEVRVKLWTSTRRR